MNACNSVEMLDAEPVGGESEDSASEADFMDEQSDQLEQFQLQSGDDRPRNHLPVDGLSRGSACRWKAT